MAAAIRRQSADSSGMRLDIAAGLRDPCAAFCENLADVPGAEFRSPIGVIHDKGAPCRRAYARPQRPRRSHRLHRRPRTEHKRGEMA